MKKHILLSLSLLFCLSAHADDFYTKLLTGPNFLQDTGIDDNFASYKTGYLVGASLGYAFNESFSVEAEYAYRRNEINKIEFFNQGESNHGHFHATSIMGNLFWNAPLCCFDDIQPYIGAGIGYDFQKMRASNDRVRFQQDWNDVSWQVMAGITYPFFCNTKLSLEYRYHQGGCRFYHHTIGIGISFFADCSE